MDLFDLGKAHQVQMEGLRQQHQLNIARGEGATADDNTCSLTLPNEPYQEQALESSELSPIASESVSATSTAIPFDLVAGLSPLRDHPVLVMGVASDILFPAWQQREIAETLRAGGNRAVTHVELGEDTSLFGHDTFLLDLEHVGGSLQIFLG